MNQEKVIKEPIEAGVIFNYKYFELILAIFQDDLLTVFKITIRVFHLLLNINFGTIEKQNKIGK